VWDLEKGQKIKTFKGHSDEVYSVSFYPNGRYALSGSSDKTLKLWEVISGKTLQTFQDHTNRIYAVDISNDGRYALSGSRDNTLKLWKLNLPPTPVIIEGLDSSYSVGDKLKVDLTESIPRRPTEIVDLWLGIQIPSGELMFLTSQPDEPFSLKAQAFKHSVDSLEMTHQVLEVEIVPGIGGEYTFYALYVQEGRDPLKAGAEVYRSNLAIKKTTLANQ